MTGWSLSLPRKSVQTDDVLVSAVLTQLEESVQPLVSSPIVEGMSYGCTADFDSVPICNSSSPSLGKTNTQDASSSTAPSIESGSATKTSENVIRNDNEIETL